MLTGQSKTSEFLTVLLFGLKISLRLLLLTTKGGVFMKIFINAGHGGNDSGAVGNNLIERDVNFFIANRVETYLLAVNYDTKLFQYDGLQAICDEANNWHADLFVSIHCNAFDGQAHGTETFYVSERGRKLANAIQNQIVSSVGTFNRGVKFDDEFFVLTNTNMPAVLVECAFIDNPYDAKLLREKEDDFARAIARGITDYVAQLRPTPDVIDFPRSF